MERAYASGAEGAVGWRAARQRPPPIRTPYAIGACTFAAVRIQTTTAKGHTVYVYDLDTGLLLFHGARTVGARDAASGPDHRASPSSSAAR